MKKYSFGKNYEYIDDYINNAEAQGKVLLYQMLIAIKEELIKKDKEISKFRGQYLKDRRFIKQRLAWIERQDLKIKALRNKLRDHGVK